MGKCDILLAGARHFLPILAIAIIGEDSSLSLFHPPPIPSCIVSVLSSSYQFTLSLLTFLHWDRYQVPRKLSSTDQRAKASARLSSSHRSWFRTTSSFLKTMVFSRALFAGIALLSFVSAQDTRIAFTSVPAVVSGGETYK